jgi:hypothetical protein
MKEVNGKWLSDMKSGEYQISYDVREFQLHGKVEVKLADNRDTTFSIYRDEHFPYKGRCIEPVTINWSAMGEQNIEITENFANGLLIATEVAKILSQPVYEYEVDYRLTNDNGEIVKKTWKCIANNTDQIINYFKVENKRQPTTCVIEFMNRGEQIKEALKDN